MYNAFVLNSSLLWQWCWGLRFSSLSFAAARAPVSHPAAGPQLPHVWLHRHLHWRILRWPLHSANPHQLAHRSVERMERTGNEVKWLKDSLSLTGTAGLSRYCGTLWRNSSWDQCCFSLMIFPTKEQDCCLVLMHCLAVFICLKSLFAAHLCVN